MQYVNDDMDELFRRAAKDYPLNTGGADWERVQKALDEPPEDEKRSSGKTDWRHLLWLLLLLPLPWICMRYSGDGDKGIAVTHTKAVKSTLPAEGMTSAAGAEISPRKQANGFTKGIDNASIVSAPILFDTKHKKFNGVTSVVSQRQEPSFDPDALREDVAEIESNERPLIQANGLKGNLSETTTIAATADTKKVVSPPVKDATKGDTATVMASANARKQQLPKEKRFYAGIIGGADITSIEMQKVKKIGYDLGGVVGYSISRKWSVEAGLLSSEKAYYSSGEHLYKAYTLPGTKLREAEGDCRMWEVPLVVRYQFRPEKQGRLFVSAGSSSYFMKKESYDYTYYYTATGQEVKRSRSYKTNSRHLFAAAQVSGGYTRRVGRSMDLRIEPYLKLPLRKVGYYDLPLTSFGVHAGITKKLY